MSMTVAYLRVSTEHQAKNGLGLELQREKVEALCQMQGWPLDKVLVDAGLSGATTARPALKKLLSLVHKDKVARVVVYRLDRLGRSLLDVITIIEKVLVPKKIALVSATEMLDTSTSQGMLFVSLLASFAQYERDAIRDRLTEGRRARVRKGGRAGGQCFGYRTENGEASIVPHEAEVVRKTFRRYAKQPSLRKLKAGLDADGVLNRRGKPFSLESLRYLLRNEFYRGVVCYEGQRFDGSHDPIVSKALFGRVQTKLSRSAKG